jgi:hypothetical protein
MNWRRTPLAAWVRRDAAEPDPNYLSGDKAEFWEQMIAVHLFGIVQNFDLTSVKDKMGGISAQTWMLKSRNWTTKQVNRSIPDRILGRDSQAISGETPKQTHASGISEEFVRRAATHVLNVNQNTTSKANQQREIMLGRPRRYSDREYDDG